MKPSLSLLAANVGGGVIAFLFVVADHSQRRSGALAASSPS